MKAKTGKQNKRKMTESGFYNPGKEKKKYRQYFGNGETEEYSSSFTLRALIAFNVMDMRITPSGYLQEIVKIEEIHENQ